MRLLIFPPLDATYRGYTIRNRLFMVKKGSQIFRPRFVALLIPWSSSPPVPFFAPDVSSSLTRRRSSWSSLRAINRVASVRSTAPRSLWNASLRSATTFTMIKRDSVPQIRRVPWLRPIALLTALQHGENAQMEYGKAGARRTNERNWR